MKPKKKKVRTVELRFFQDDANGEWGVTHKHTCPDQGNETEFNAFWDGMGLFHDVFEHAHEFTDKHFRAYPYALNIGGEVAAMGQSLYFIECLHMDRFPGLNLSRGTDENAMQITLGMMKDQIGHDSGSYGSALESNVPKQEDTGDGVLEWIIKEHFDQIQRYPVYNSGGKYIEEEQRAREYKDSVTLEKLENLYRYGWNMGHKLTGGLMRNGVILGDFIAFWSDFCKANSAETLGALYKGIDFTLYKDADGLISWKAEFVSKLWPSYEAPPAIVLKGGPDGIPEAREIDVTPELNLNS